MPAKDAARKRRRHSPRQLQHRPVTVTNCGPVTVSTELRGKQVVVVIEHSDGATVEQPPATDIDFPPPAAVDCP